MKPGYFFFVVLLPIVIGPGTVAEAAIRAGAAQVEITLPVGLEIQHYFRINEGVHDPLFARCLYFEDDNGSEVAIVCLDLIFGDFDTCDQLRAEILQQAGVRYALINFSHSHSSAELGPRGRSRVSNDSESAWNDKTIDAILGIVQEAKGRAEPANLRVGRAAANVGFNRRLVNTDTGRVYMGVNRNGPSVPWVNVLSVDSKETGEPLSVLFETAAHPVIVPHTTNRISADYPGEAVRRIREELGEDVVAMFAQGCGGNINGFPLRSSYENAIARGRGLAESVLKALDTSSPIEADSFQVGFAQAALPSHPLPSQQQVTDWLKEYEGNQSRIERLTQLQELIRRGEQPPARRLDIYSLAFGDEWCLTTLPHEMFCQYELWIDEHAPFKKTMTFGYTNGYEGYVAVDEAWKMGAKGGYEAASLPNWGGQVHTKHFGPPAVGCEKIIKDTISSLWPKAQLQPNPRAIQPAADAPQPRSPAESVAQMRLPDGFRIELVASEPVVQDPSCIAFDERGRLFVCELHGYNIEGHLDVQELNKTGQLDKQVRRVRWEFLGGEIAEKAAALQHGVVKMLVDTNADGIMDNAEVWADDLPPCYGVIAARGGIIVVCAPDIVFLADRDGDGKADVRETLFTGFRTQTLERGINNPRWGLDNWIYVGAGGDGGTITGSHLKHPVELTHSDFRIKPDGSAIEPVTGRVGTFGMTINDVGDRFPATGGRPAMYALPLGHRYLARNPFVETPPTNYSAVDYNRGFRISNPHPWRMKRQQDPAWVKFYGERETNSNYFSGGCSNEFYGDTLFPEQYHGNLFYCEPSLNIVHRCVVKRDGAGYRGARAAGDEQSEFLASTDQWFRPMNLRIGPEGALYVVDMYREIIEDYSAIPRFLQQQYGLNKGADHGRIWRLVPDSFQGQPAADLASVDDVTLAQELASPITWRRQTAQRLLVERGATSQVQLLSSHVRNSGEYQACLHALHTLNGLGKLDAETVTAALGHQHYAVRAHGLRLSERWLDSDSELLNAVLELLDDEDPRVRLQVAMTLGESESLQATEALLRLATKYGNERWMDAAILSSSVSRAGDLLIGLLGQSNAIGESALLRALAATVAGQEDFPAMQRTIRAISGLGEAVQIECLTGLANGLSRQQRQVRRAAEGWSTLSELLHSESSTVQRLAVELTSRLLGSDTEWLTPIFESAAATASKSDGSEDRRRLALETLRHAPYEQKARVAIQLLEPQQPTQIQLAAIETLAASTNPSVAEDLLAQWQSYTPGVRKAVTKVVTAQANRLPAFVSAIEDGMIASNEVTPAMRERLLDQPDKEAAARASALLSVPTTEAEITARLETYQLALSGPRDTERGKRVFHKTCIACHKVNDEGHDVGPALGTIINRPDEAILFEILVPSASIDPEYQSYTVTTSSGRVVTGVLASESPTSVTLRQEKGATETVLRRDIELMKASRLSLMPSDLHKQISPEDAANLIEYMRHALVEKAN